VVVSSRRVVRALPELFNIIERQLDDTVRSSFLADHLFTIVDAFAERFDHLAPAPGEDPRRCRILIGAYQSLGYVVTGCLQLDNAVELYDIEFDLIPPWMNETLNPPEDLD
jgi:hypothetical protein